MSCSRAQQTSSAPWAGLWVPSRRPGSTLKAPARGVYPRQWLLRRLARTALSPSAGPRGSLAFEKGLSLCPGSLPTPAPPQLHFLSCFPGILQPQEEAKKLGTGPCLLSAAEAEGARFLLTCALEEVASVDMHPPDLAPPLGALCNTPAPPRGTRTWGMRQTPGGSGLEEFLTSPKSLSLVCFRVCL